MDKTPDLLKRLKVYSASDAYPFHMPGHKRQVQMEFAEAFPNPFSIDITEIQGFDNLHYPKGILKESMEWAADIYGADRTYYLVNGSSCGILSAICGTTVHGGTILLSRNCHKSAYNGVILNCLRSEYSYPQILPEFGIQGGLSTENIESLLIKYPEIQSVLVVSPTYEGIVSDIREISQVVHKYGIPLVVDEAHGAHFSYGIHGGFPVSALELGADVVIQSLHKTLPSLTQTAVMHIKKGYVDMEKIDRYVHMFQSSSPSYVLMAAIENCIRFMNGTGRERMEDFGRRLDKLRGQLKGMKQLSLLTQEHLGHFCVMDMDKSKIVVSCRGTGISGEQLEALLRQNFHLEMEMCGPDYVTAITSLADTEAGLQRLAAAMLCIDSMLNDEKAADILKTDRESQERCSTETFHPFTYQETVMNMAEAMDGKKEELMLEESAGRIAAEFVYLYPPGIPILAPGERIRPELIGTILAYGEMGLPIQGLQDPDTKKIWVIAMGDCCYGKDILYNGKKFIRKR